MADPIKFIDLHAHFPMHTPFPPMPFANPGEFWKKGVFDTLNATVNFEELKPRVSLHHWFKDDQNFAVTGFGSVLYDAQDDFFVGTVPIPSAIDHIGAQITNVESEIKADGRVRIAYSPADVESFLNAGQKFIFHTLEGGFSVGDNAANVTTLADAGVASLVPAHLLYRGVATCENGFPPSVFPLFKRDLDDQPNLGLTDLGTAIVETCFQRGVIVDITHARADAQQDIFDIADGYPDAPLISSHNGVQTICDAGLNLSDDAIRRIQKSNGIIGVIFYTQWLRHLEGHDPRPDLQLVTDIIDHIHAVTGSYDNIGIGSDLDGFIAPIKLASDYSKMSAISQGIIAKYGRTVADKILYQNALRVLYAGWRGAAA